ncbi:MAG: GNAT family N-acetyltransferase [Bacteroidales bacterium]|nr:GNAT family N-acetyltransferase [Bacteroidales bacterium]
MVYNGILEGKFVNLRSVKEEDSAFILEIRNNPEISRYIPQLNVNVEQQCAWIRKQRADNDSLYFIIEDKSKQRIGTVSVYNIIQNHAEVGRSCSIGDSIQNSETGILHDDFIFNVLCLDYLDVWVYKDNTHVLSLNKGFGCEWDGEALDKDGIPYLYGKITKQNYLLKSQKIRNNINKIKIH